MGWKIVVLYNKSYDKNVAAMNLYVWSNTTLKYIKVKLAGKYKMRNEQKCVLIDFNTPWPDHEEFENMENWTIKIKIMVTWRI